MEELATSRIDVATPAFAHGDGQVRIVLLEQALKAQPENMLPESRPDPELERRVAELQSVVRTLAKNKPSVPEAVESSLPIENAVRMAKHGASIDDLIRNCGLNIGEAQLMRKLHGKAANAPTA